MARQAGPLPATEARDVLDPAPGALVFRHRLSTRLWHWTNALTFFIMLMSGLMIFNAHPRLYWGEYGANADPAWLQIGATSREGIVMIGDEKFITTGVLGRWTDSEGREQTRAFPGWATIPSTYSLADARRWHLTFAWLFGLALLVYLVRSAWNGHIRHTLFYTRAELRWSAIWDDIINHLKLRFHHSGAAALSYNFLQKTSYMLILFVILPVLILTGLTMSPGMNAAWPWLLDLFGGRQSARSIHFICAALGTGFIVVHLVLVVLAGPFNEIRSMVTGWFRIPKA